VPYRTTPDALVSLLRNDTQLLIDSYAALRSAIEDKRIRPLATSGAKRSKVLPDVPTVEEAGVRDFDLTLWAGVFAPRGTPPEIVGRLNREINQVLGRPEVREPLARDGAEITPMSVDQFAGFVRSEASKYAKITMDDFCSRFMFGGCVGYGLYNPL